MRRRRLGALAASVALISLIGGVTFASAARNSAPQNLWSRASSSADAGSVASRRRPRASARCGEP